MAVDAPLSPVLTVDNTKRTLTSIVLNFSPDVDNGGSSIIGYLLYRDEGVAGSPLSLLYNGTGKPEIINYNAT
jgi:hypothetical protein